MLQARWDKFIWASTQQHCYYSIAQHKKHNFSSYWEPKLCTEELEILLNWGWKKTVVCRKRMGNKNQIILSTSWHPRLLPWKGHHRRAIPDSTPKVIYKYGWKDSASSLFGQRRNHLCLQIPTSTVKMLLCLPFPAIFSFKSKNGLF